MDRTRGRGTRNQAPDKTTLKRLLAKGLTQQQVADEWEKLSGFRVSRSAVGMAIKRYGLKSAHKRTRYEDMIPWVVKTEHAMHSEARLLRLEARRRRREALTDKEKSWLEGWLKQLNAAHAVVTYDPDTDEGFFWTPRKPEDDDIVRRPA